MKVTKSNDVTQDRINNSTQMPPEEAGKSKPTVIKPETKYGDFFNSGKMMLIAGTVATVGVALFILIGNNTTQAAEAAKQAAELAERAANLQKPCIVANQKQLFAGTGEQIANCGLQMVANDNDIEIKCDAQFVEETGKKYGLKHDLNCDSSIKNNFNGDVVITHRPSGGRFGGFGQVEIAAENVSPYLKNHLSLGGADFTLTLNQARVKEWESNFQDAFKSLENGAERQKNVQNTEQKKIDSKEPEQAQPKIADTKVVDELKTQTFDECKENVNKILAKNGKDSMTRRVVNVFGGVDGYCSLPGIPWSRSFVGNTDYIDRISQGHTTASVMRGFDQYSRPTVVLRTCEVGMAPYACEDNLRSVETLFQRSTGNGQTWAIGGHYGNRRIVDSGAGYLDETAFQKFEKLINEKKVNIKCNEAKLNCYGKIGDIEVRLA